MSARRSAGNVCRCVLCRFLASLVFAQRQSKKNEHQHKNKKAEKDFATGEHKAAVASAEGKMIYRTMYRDVVKYVNDPNHNKCNFDVRKVQLWQRISHDLMNPPYKASNAGRDSDETCSRIPRRQNVCGNFARRATIGRRGKGLRNKAFLLTNHSEDWHRRGCKCIYLRD